MISTAFHFTAGRFHATPWGRHVNEGVPEWPPSPWRLLRALVAVWRRTLSSMIPEERMRAILKNLAAPPEYFLPPAELAHVRHYMPWDKKGPGDKTLVFDTFVSIEPDAHVIAVWLQADLAEENRKDLVLLLDNLPYLGRAESWCRAALVTSTVDRTNCFPLKERQGLPPRYETIKVLCASDPLCFEALFVETADMRKKGRIDPPEARWISYARRSDSFTIKPAAKTTHSQAENLTMARYALDSTVLPLLTDALSLAELARRALLKLRNDPSPILAGKAADGRPLQGHGHAFYLPEDEDGDGRIDHLTVYAANGFSAQDQQALGRLQRLYRNGGSPDIYLALLGIGCDTDFSSPLLGPSRVWRSSTPFILFRHPKWRGDTMGGKISKRLVDGPEDQLRLELRRRGFGQKVEVAPEEKRLLRGRSLRWLEFRRWRSGRAAVGLPCGFRLTFEQEAWGPLALGYACHFGLGTFVHDGGAG